MGVTTHPYVPVSDAPYPVINAQPTFFATFRNLTLGDYFLFLSMTTLGAGYGFAAGARALLRLRTSTPGCLLHSPFFSRSSSDLFSLHFIHAQASRCAARASSTSAVSRRWSSRRIPSARRGCG